MELDLTDALAAAPKLLGMKLVHQTPDGLLGGYIVETEAYTAEDAASHTYRGQTARNRVMFGPAGYMYVYFTYGMHYCVNVVTGKRGQGQGVLIRALQPLMGIELMRQRRGRQNDLTNGPAKLAQALGLTKAHNGTHLLNGGDIRLEPGLTPESITQTTRIGIRKDTHRPWRFYIAGNPHVSQR